VSWWRLLGWQKPDWPWLSLAAVGACLGGAVTPCFALLCVAMLIAFFDIDNAALRSKTATLAGYFVLVGGVAALAKAAEVYGSVRAGERLTRRLRRAAFASVLRQDMAFFDEATHTPGALVTRLASDALLVKTGAGERLTLLAECGASIVTALAIAFSQCWQLALLLLACAPLLVLSSKLQVRASVDSSRGARASVEHAGHVASEATAAIHTVTAYGLQPAMVAMFERALASAQDARRRAILLAGVCAGFSEWCVYATYALAFYAGAHFMERQLLGFEALLRVILTITFAAQSAGRAANALALQSKAGAAAASIFELIDLAPSAERGGVAAAPRPAAPVAPDASESAVSCTQ
jgi:ABC-type multidrug transport system fused ATPase/permease subunit